MECLHPSPFQRLVNESRDGRRGALGRSPGSRSSVSAFPGSKPSGVSMRTEAFSGSATSHSGWSAAGFHGIPGLSIPAPKRMESLLAQTHEQHNDRSVL